MHLLQLALLTGVYAQFGSFFDQMFQQQAQQQQQQQNRGQGANPLERLYHDIDCNEYLCPDSLQCVSEPLECPCPFPDSQIKCTLPDKSTYFCISKPSSPDGPDCKFVLDAYRNKV